MKRSTIVISIIVLSIMGILIWGFIGAHYKSAIPEERIVCDFGIMESLDVGSPNVYLCWIWHTSNFRDAKQIQEELGKLFSNNS